VRWRGCVRGVSKSEMERESVIGVGKSEMERVRE
jgi:hypothetical protein